MTTRSLKSIVNFEIQGDYSSFKNCLIKLKNNNYFFSILLYKSTFISSHNYIKTIFNFNTNEISGYNKIKDDSDMKDFINSTSCFQTEN